MARHSASKPAEFGVKSIASLARGLRVLKLLQTKGPLALAALHNESGFPKATLLRILKTLNKEGLIWQRMADGAYVASQSLFELASQMDRESALVEIAAPALQRLSEATKWPSVLAVPRLTHMEVIETNVSRTHVDHIPLGPVGFRVNMLRSASGRAYVSFCETPVRDAILDALVRSEFEGDRVAANGEYVRKLLQETRSQGFALRDPDFGGDFNAGRAHVDDGRDSLAAPILVGGHVPGTINITWAKRSLSRAEAIQRLAPATIAAAKEVAELFG